MGRALRRLGVAVAAVVALYAIAGFLLAPALLERTARQLAADAFDGELAVAGVRVNPFLFTFDARGVELRTRHGGTVVTAGHVRADLRSASLYRGVWTLTELRADRVAVRQADAAPLLELGAARVAGGLIDLAQRQVRVASVELRDGIVRAAVDESGAVDWRAITGASPAASGERSRAWHITVDRIDAKGLAARYTDRSRAPAIALDVRRVDASLALEARSEAGGADVVARDVRIALERVRLAELDGGAALGGLDGVALAGGHLDTAKRELGAAALTAVGGGATLVFDERGELELARALAPPQGGAIRREAEALARRAREAGQPWRYALGRAAVEKLELAVAMRGAGAVRYDVALVGATVASTDPGQPMRFDAALAVRQGGTLRAAGSVARDFSAADGTLAAEGVNLAPLAPLVARYVAVDLASGRGSAAARLRFAADASPHLTARGTFGVDDLLVNEAATGERLLAWESLTAEDVDLALAPGLLSIGQIRVQAPGAKIDIDEARRLNLTQLLRREAKAGDRPRGAPAEERFPVRIARVALRGGTVDFSDRSLALPFATRVQRLNGTILGIASDRASRAELRLSGLVQDSGSARAEGAIQPSDPAAFTDIRAVFNNVAVPPLSPYSVTFAGRKVESGRLWLDLHYRVVDGRLSARNQIALDDFRLGERVASRRALDLPLDLAVTLLRDDKGRIRVAVPIEGDVRSPRFDYGRLVREALARLVTRVVTAPFRFLAGGGAELEAVHFEPGRARLAPPERETLDRVAKTLAERPELKLVVRGPYDPRRDGEALRELAVRRELAAALRTKPAERDGPVPVAYGDAATQRALEQLLAARAGDDAIDRLAGQHKQSTGGAAQRVNPVFAVFGRASPDRELYEAVFRRLVELQPLDDDGLQALAVRRAEAITAYLVQSGRLAAARIENGAVQAVDAGSEPSIEAELGLGLERRPS